MLLVDHYGTDAYFNLALEEYLLDHFDEDIFMLWQNDNAIVVGQNQNTRREINEQYVRQHGIRVVRRLTGGGAVYHDLGNLNFSFICKNRDGWYSDFSRFTAPIVATLQSLGVDAKASGRNDILIGDRKISGNAQVVRGSRLLHHGTLLFSSNVEDITGALNVSPQKIHSKGIKSVASRVTNISSHLIQPMPLQQFRSLLAQNIGGRSYRLTDQDRKAVRQLRDQKYATWQWNYGYSPRYNFHQSRYFPAGTVEVMMEVKSGVIQQVQVYGDFFAKHDISEIEQALVGARHDWAEIKTIINSFDLSDYFFNISNDQLLQCFF